MAITQDDLIGSWQLVSWEVRYGDARDKSFPFGDDACGQLIYEKSGCMSATVSRAGRAVLSTANVRQAPEAEKAAAFDSYFHYAGTWRIAGERVVHMVALSLNPAFIGTDQVRLAELKGDLLTLSAMDSGPGGLERQHCLVWRRV